MRHRMKGRKLGRNASHRRAMFRNMATSLICSVRVDEDDPQAPKVPGRIVTTVAKAKELRPYVEKLVTMARKSLAHTERAAEFSTSADRNTEEWKSWRNSEQWNKWNQAIAPAVNYRRRAFALLRDKTAVDVLFAELAERFEDRPGGYTRVVRLADVRLGDAAAPMVVEDDETEAGTEENAETESETAVDESAAGSETSETEAETAEVAGEEPADDDKKAEE